MPLDDLLLLAADRCLATADELRTALEEAAPEREATGWPDAAALAVLTTLVNLGVDTRRLGRALGNTIRLAAALR